MIHTSTGTSSPKLVFCKSCFLLQRLLMFMAQEEVALLLCLMVILLLCYLFLLLLFIFIIRENWLLDTESDHALLLDIQNGAICWRTL